MSERIESDAQSEVGYPATGSETLTYSPELRGSAPSLDAHEHANDHFALIYESREEQFAAAIPFIRKGLERDERCLYITYENTRAEVIEAMRAYDIDVDTALDSGQLSIHDEEETYLRNETFDADETLEFIDAAIEDATEEYEALRMPSSSESFSSAPGSAPPFSPVPDSLPVSFAPGSLPSAELPSSSLDSFS